MKAKRSETGHRYGGPWTELKLTHVQYYLQCYVNALTAAGFDLWYIDAFAGSGSREAEREVGGLFENRPLETIVESLDGSAAISLQIRPSFDHFVFIDGNEGQVRDLKSMCATEKRDVRIIHGDANEELLGLISRPPWSQAKHGSRGVVFLDPYALEVNFATLEALARTETLDVWYLFPLESIVRQLARRFSGVGVKEQRLDIVLGPNWRELYDMPPPSPAPRLDLLDDAPDEELERRATVDQIQEWFRGQLANCYAHVPPPITIRRSPNRPMFSLFLCVGNPSPKATKLADDFMKYVRLGRKPASRQTSVP